MVDYFAPWPQPRRKVNGRLPVNCVAEHPFALDRAEGSEWKPIWRERKLAWSASRKSERAATFKTREHHHVARHTREGNWARKFRRSKKKKKKEIYISPETKKKKKTKRENEKASSSRRIEPIKFPPIYARSTPAAHLPRLLPPFALYRETVCHASESYSRTVPRKSSQLRNDPLSTGSSLFSPGERELLLHRMGKTVCSSR